MGIGRFPWVFAKSNKTAIRQLFFCPVAAIE
jgi:hypothetical protein